MQSLFATGHSQAWRRERGTLGARHWVETCFIPQTLTGTRSWTSPAAPHSLARRSPKVMSLRSEGGCEERAGSAQHAYKGGKGDGKRQGMRARRKSGYSGNSRVPLGVRTVTYCSPLGRAVDPSSAAWSCWGEKAGGLGRGDVRVVVNVMEWRGVRCSSRDLVLYSLRGAVDRTALYCTVTVQ